MLKIFQNFFDLNVEIQNGKRKIEKEKQLEKPQPTESGQLTKIVSRRQV
jgi:hypothetical protein